MKKDGKKSVHIKMLLNKEYNLTEVPSRKKIVYMESDYSFFKEYEYKEDK